MNIGMVLEKSIRVTLASLFLLEQHQERCPLTISDMGASLLGMLIVEVWFYKGSCKIFKPF